MSELVQTVQPSGNRPEKNGGFPRVSEGPDGSDGCPPPRARADIESDRGEDSRARARETVQTIHTFQEGQESTESLAGRFPDGFGDHPEGSIDIEDLVRWAVARTGDLPWSRSRDRELMFDHGVTAKPRKKRQPGVALAVAIHRPRALPARMDPGPDAGLVLEEVRRLDPWTASIILVNARRQSRPDWMEGVEPKRIAKRKRSRRRKRRGRGGYQTVWVWDVDPLTIRACREIYARWHVGLSRLAERLADRLARFKIKGFAAPVTPWQK